MKKLLTHFQKAFGLWQEDRVPQMSAALAYYTIFSIAPLLLIVMAILGLFFGETNAEHQIIREIQGLVGENSAETLENMVEATKEDKAIGATILGTLALLLGALGVVIQLKDALNVIWGVKTPSVKGLGKKIWVFLRRYLISFSMVLGIAFLLLISLVVSSLLTGLVRYLSGDQEITSGLLIAGEFVLSLGITTLLFVLLYRYLPDKHPKWRILWWPALFTALLFQLGKLGLSVYLGGGSLGSSFGAAGSLVIILIWVYYSSQIFLFGAELAKVSDNKK